MCSSRALVAVALVVPVAALSAACTKPWSKREMISFPLAMTDGSPAHVTLPSGMKLDTPGFYTGEDGPYVNIGHGSVFKSTEDYAAQMPGSGFESRAVEDGFGVAYENNGPNVYVERTFGKEVLTCSGSFAAGPESHAARADLLWKICSSMRAGT